MTGPDRCENCRVQQVYSMYAPFCTLACREEHFERMIEEPNDDETNSNPYPWSKKDGARHG